MSRIILTAICLLVATVTALPEERVTEMKQTWQPDWQQLDSRPAPDWFRDAKFGIFIHWGVYSVPAWSPRGSYAEWYLYGMNDPESEVRKYHDRVWGADFNYKEFAPLFKAELWEPTEWADLFRRSGARYVVLTSKHHDGYCLWPSSHRPGWNSVETGPQRDLVGELTNAVTEAGLKSGLYYSLAEWTHPFYRWYTDSPNNDVDRYVDEYMIPQFKDLVESYNPSLIFTDGEWSHSAATYRAEELIAWLYNRPESVGELIINDRWGGDTRFKHGGYWATEYSDGLAAEEHPWEECRGMGHSFGYNRAENADDYLTADELIRMLVRLVSNGGNLLLNIGPDANGKIPPIMQERLLQIGDWLKVNGEGIYGTRRWENVAEGESIRYTADEDGAVVYAFCRDWPQDELKLKVIRPDAGSEVRLLGVDEQLEWSWDDVAGLTISVPQRLRDTFSGSLSASFCFRIVGEAARLTDRPQVGRVDQLVVERELFTDQQEVCITTDEPGTAIYYTLDGSKPDLDSPRYREPFVISASTVVNAMSWRRGYVSSLVSSAEFNRVECRLVDKPGALVSGLNCAYYECKVVTLPDFSKLVPVTTGVVDYPVIEERLRDDYFAFRFNGFLQAPTAGIYKFSLDSDDGSRLYIGDELVVDNDGLHGAGTGVEGQVALSRGVHAITIEHFEREGDQSLVVNWQPPGRSLVKIPANAFFRKELSE